MVQSFSFRRLLTHTASLCGIYLATRCSLAWIIGSRSSFFSLGTVAAPALGWFQGIAGIGQLLLLHTMVTAMRFALVGGCTLSPLLMVQVYHISTICAGLYLAGVRTGGRTAFWTRILAMAISGGMMVLFMLHPVGYAARAYTLYWLIPLIASFYVHRSVLLHALTATFIAHAIGSVAWIWHYPTTAAYWIALIPVVAIERLCMAGMLACVMGFTPVVFRYVRKAFDWNMNTERSVCGE